MFDDYVHECSPIEYCDNISCRNVPIDVDGEPMWRCLQCGYVCHDDLRLEWEENLDE